MKNLSFFKGLLIGSILSVTMWVLAVSAITTILDLEAPSQETYTTELYATNPPT